jgi:3-phenylpropionate/trans-cinnamate dioxygenase ferredoxin subunit
MLTFACKLDELVEGRSKRVDIQGNKVAVVRIGDDVYAIGDTCSHQNYSLSEGAVLTDDLEIECPKHGSTFDLLSGQPRSLPATKAVPVYQVSVEDGNVMVSIDVDHIVS